MPFKKGASGNPGGRPKALATVQDMARSHTEASIATLAFIRDNPEAADASRVAASQALLDRGWGRPSQSVALGQDPNLGPIQTDAIVRPPVSREEWIKLHK